MLRTEQEEALVNFLSIVYSSVPWSKMKTSKNVHDIFNHRVRAAARRETIYQFTSKLCNYFGLQSLPHEAQVFLDELRPCETEVLNVLSREHIPYCVRAIILAKERKEKVLKRVEEIRKKIEEVNK